MSRLSIRNVRELSLYDVARKAGHASIDILDSTTARTLAENLAMGFGVSHTEIPEFVYQFFIAYTGNK